MTRETSRMSQADTGTEHAGRADGLRRQLQQMFVRATLDGVDMNEHLVLLVDTSTRPGRWFAEQANDASDDEDSEGPESGDQTTLYLASKEDFGEALEQITVEPPTSADILNDPVAPGAMRLVCIGDDIVYLDIPVAEGWTLQRGRLAAWRAP